MIYAVAKWSLRVAARWGFLKWGLLAKQKHKAMKQTGSSSASELGFSCSFSFIQKNCCEIRLDGEESEEIRGRKRKEKWNNNNQKINKYWKKTAENVALINLTQGERPSAWIRALMVNNQTSLLSVELYCISNAYRSLLPPLCAFCSPLCPYMAHHLSDSLTKVGLTLCALQNRLDIVQPVRSHLCFRSTVLPCTPFKGDSWSQYSFSSNWLVSVATYFYF